MCTLLEEKRTLVDKVNQLEKEKAELKSQIKQIVRLVTDLTDDGYLETSYPLEVIQKIVNPIPNDIQKGSPSHGNNCLFCD